MTFECATNLTGYTLLFAYSGSIDQTFKETNLPGGGIKITTTFILTSANNSTSLRCIADDNVNSLFTLFAYAYAQGK